MRVHLLDGTYELFRHFYAMPRQADLAGREVGAIIGVLGSVLGMLEGGTTHLGVATDHVIESFRNGLWAGYKTSEGVEPELLAQFHPLEDALRAMGVVVWAMVEFEADDALAAAARRAAESTEVEQVIICTPDKDLSQCVRGERVVQFDRRKREQRDEKGVVARFGVGPASIPDYLALVGDSADGFPGVPGWGEKASGTVLGRYQHLERIPTVAKEWEVAVRGAARLSAALEENRTLALLFRTLATVRTDVPVFTSLDELRWRGPTAQFEQVAQGLAMRGLWERAQRAAKSLNPVG
ncbi:MAG TPA: 5'-3' exonuclease H3TH domain-containing protein [Gemmatimonadales bacterium]|nr:5'-3' exonuclease H3TH domain-containing protein [Gemmatimonadales bacterium]